jgi:hypothetical protein
MKKIKIRIAIIIFTVLIITSIFTIAKSYQSDLQERFDECTETNGGDWGCDSCHYVVYGYYEDE